MQTSLIEAFNDAPINLDRILRADRKEVCELLRSRNPSFISNIHQTFGSRSALERAAMCRMIRHSLESDDDVEIAMSNNFDAWLNRSLEIGANLEFGERLENGDDTNMWERKQAFRCIVRVFEISADKHFGASFARSIIAIAANRDDRLRVLCLDLLRKVLMSNPKLIAECDGTKVLFDAIIDPSLSFLTEPLILSLLSVMNTSKTRKLLRPMHDVQRLLAPFTDIDFQLSSDRAEVWAASRRALVLMLRSWTGIVVLSSDPHGLSSILNLLRDHAVDAALQFAILDFVVEPLHPVMNAFRKMPLKGPDGREADGTIHHRNIGIIAEQTYAAVLCLAFIHCGLVEGLTFLGVRGDDTGEIPLHLRAISVLASFLVVVTRIFPEELSVGLLSMPEVIEVVSGGSFASERDKRDASSNAQMMLVNLANSLSTEDEFLERFCESSEGPDLYVALKASIWEATERENSMLYDTPSLVDYKPSIERKVFLAQMEASQVNNTKEWRQWKWDVIRQLLEETLKEKEFFIEALRNHKWIKRVCGFFRCDAEKKEREKAFFAGLPWEIKHLKKLECARLLFTILLETEEGKQYLNTDRRGCIFPAIVREIEKAIKGITSVFDPHTSCVTMAREFITILGHVSTLPSGRAFIDPLLREPKYKGCLEKMGNLEKFDFLSQLLLHNFDFASPEWLFPRELVDTWLNGQISIFLRICINSKIQALVRDSQSRLFQADKARTLERWAISILQNQIKCGNHMVVEGAIHIIIEALTNADFFDIFVDEFDFDLLRADKPIWLASDSLNYKMRMLTIKVSATTAGFEKLRKINWLDGAISQWERQDEQAYSNMIDSEFSRILSMRSQNSIDSNIFRLRRSDLHRVEDIPLNSSEVEALSRLPWSITLKVEDPKTKNKQYLTTKVDVQGFKSKNEGDLIRVKGTILDENSIPKSCLVGGNLIFATLFMGSYAVNLDGSLTCVFDKNHRDSKHGAIHSDGIVGGAANVVKAMRSHASHWCQYSSGEELTTSSSQGFPLWHFDMSDDNVSKGIVAVEFFLSVPESSLPPSASHLHLYGELARHSKGCSELTARKIVPIFIEQIKDASYPATKRFNAIITLGQIGSSENGFQYLLEQNRDVMAILLNVVNSDDDLSIRGAAFCALGLWSHSSTACQNFQSQKNQKNQWSCTGDPFISIAIPRNHSDLFNISTVGDILMPRKRISIIPLSLTNDETEIISALEKLVCSIYQKEAKELVHRYVSLYFLSAKLFPWRLKFMVASL